MKSVVVIGAGKIGSTITQLLSRSGDYKVVVADRSRHETAPPPPDASLSGPFQLDKLREAIEAAEQPRPVPAAA